MEDTRWREEFEVHTEDAAVQHRRLTGLVQVLLKAIEESQPPRIIRGAFADLLNYIELHFSDEEQFMRRSGYPEPLLNSHALVHSTVLERVRELYSQYEQGGPLDVKLPARLHEWLDQEEAEHDKRYLDYFRARAGI